MEEKKYLSIGKILNFHGIKGEMKAGYSKKETISDIKSVYLEHNGNKISFDVEFVRFHKNFAIIKLKGIESINDVLEYKGKNIYSLKEQIEKNLEKDEFLIDDLIGMKVFNDSEDYIGEVVEVAQNKLESFLNVDFNGKIVMIPFVNELVPVVDIKKKTIIIKPIEGLL